MIDGFGWFPEPLYRRNWLLFDDVDYAFPHFVKSISIPRAIAQHTEFQIVQPELGDDVIDRIVAQAAADAADPAFRAMIESVPRRDAEYASGIVYADQEVRDRHLLRAPDGVFAMSYLAQKLVAYASSCGSVPIVGQDYAVELLSRVVRREKQQHLAPASLITDRQALNVHAIAAGLSLRFISDDVLTHADIDDMQAFKEKSASLRDLHHAQLLKAARDYDGLPVDDKFAERLAALRADAESVRNELDLQGRDLWASLGLQLADKGGAAAIAAGSIVGAIAMIRADLFAAAAAAIPAAVYAASQIVQTLHHVKTQSRSYVSYLTDARQYLSAV